MSVTGSWGGHQFIVSSTLIRSFQNLTVKRSSDVETKTSSEEEYVSRKAAKPAEVTLSVTLNAYLGSDVRNDANEYLDAAGNGVSDYLYVGDGKLIEPEVMLTDASLTEVEISPTGKWASAKMQLTFKQSTKNDGGTAGESDNGGSSGSGGSKKATAYGTGALKKELSHGATTTSDSSGAGTSSLNKALTQVKTIINTAKKKTLGR